MQHEPAKAAEGKATSRLARDYRNFASKDDLVVAYLEERSEVFLRDCDAAFDRYRDNPRAQLRAIMTNTKSC